MTRYRLSDQDIIHAWEFLRAPFAYKGPGLQQLVNAMRAQGPKGKYVLICREPYARWGLGRLPGARGAAVEEIPGVEYGSLESAERDVFLRRWREMGGQPLDQVMDEQ